MTSGSEIPVHLRTLAVALLGGLAAYLAGMPSPWLVGPMIATAAAAIAGERATLVRPLQLAAGVIIGISLGAGVRPATLALLPKWPLTLAGVLLSTLAITLAGRWFFTRICRWDRSTALLASLPGVVSVVMMVAAESGADIRRVATAQSLRLLLLVALLPSLVVIAEGASPGPLPGHEGTVVETVILVAAAAAGAALFMRLKFPAGGIIGAMAVSGFLHATGLSDAFPPPWLTLGAFVIMGAMIGQRFSGTSVAELRRTGLDAIGGFAVSLAVSGLVVVGLYLLVGLPMSQLMLAFAPGGIDSMSSLALILHLDTGFVVAHQFFRFMIIAVSLPFLGRFLKGGAP